MKLRLLGTLASYCRGMAARLFLSSAALCTVSCLEVTELGEEWDKGILDPNLAGRWKGAFDTEIAVELDRERTLYLLTIESETLEPETWSVRAVLLGKRKGYLMVMPGSAWNTDRKYDRNTGFVLPYRVTDSELEILMIRGEGADVTRKVPTISETVLDEMKEMVESPAGSAFSVSRFRRLSPATPGT